MRIRLTVRYDGTDFAGSQVQPGKRTVAGTLTAGLETLLGQPVKLVFASRTDSGVHAEGNVCAFDAELPFPVARLPRLVGKLLPADLIVRDAVETGAGFHPRFDATLRTYAYRCHLAAEAPIHLLRYAAAVPDGWDMAAVQKVLNGLHGSHCFAGFSMSGFSAVNSWCTVIEARIEQTGQNLVVVISANRFLRHMVVRIMGALFMVARGGLSADEVLAALDGSRSFQLRPAPAKGLTLVAVQYE